MSNPPLPASAILDAIDEPALIDALEGGVIAGAALDVFAVEPLPAESPLWRTPSGSR